MNDSFLHLHRIDELQFSISGLIAPASIRDQIVRGKMFVDRARARGFISESRPLLVMGAGAGGMTATIAALRLGIRVTLIDRNLRAFGRQRKCLTRWIDPTQYDWPSVQWDRGEYPWRDAIHPLRDVPLPWKANWANKLAAQWLIEFQKAQERYGELLELNFGTIVHGLPYYRPPDKMLAVRYGAKGSTTGKTVAFGAVLYARGAGQERVTSGPKHAPYRGFRFWETDPFELLQLGLGEVEEPRRVLICGSGDGALQDFLRIATGLKSAKEILQAVLPDFDRGLLHRLYSEEDQGLRAKVWNGLRWDHNVQMRLDAVHLRIAAELLPRKGGNTEIEERIAGLLRHSDGVELRLVHPCQHFTAIYPLNRFVVYLLYRYATVAGLSERIDIRPGRSLATVECVDHEPQKSPRDCHGLEHKVTLRKEPDCRPSPTPLLVEVERPFHSVVVRFGPEPGPGPHLKVNRHTLPYHSAL